MTQQQKKLLNALVLVVENLRNPSALGPVLSALGGRHVGYGSLPKQYPAVGKALLLTFEEYLQDDWTPGSQESVDGCLWNDRRADVAGCSPTSSATGDSSSEDRNFRRNTSSFGDIAKIKNRIKNRI
ncbi:globin domain-containing protein [Microcoleus sp. Aus8_D3]|uniref:globin domain-containing protein n=1 Tax=unclassified Microcoleus TaxID=2642155 RepID=UPI0034DD6BCE